MRGPVAQRVVVSRTCNFPPPVHRGRPGVSWHDEGWSIPHNAVLWSAWASRGTPDWAQLTPKATHFLLPFLAIGASLRGQSFNNQGLQKEYSSL